MKNREPEKKSSFPLGKVHEVMIRLREEGLIADNLQRIIEDRQLAREIVGLVTKDSKRSANPVFSKPLSVADAKQILETALKNRDYILEYHCKGFFHWHCKQMMLKFLAWHRIRTPLCPEGTKGRELNVVHKLGGYYICPECSYSYFDNNIHGY